MSDEMDDFIIVPFSFDRDETLAYLNNIHPHTTEAQQAELERV